MSKKPMKAILVGRWHVGHSNSTGHTILSFEFSNKRPVNLAISRDEAEKIAIAILRQIASPPSKPSQMN